MKLKIVSTVSSTNDTLKEWLREGLSEPTLLIARHQSGGRGQFDHSWKSPKGLGLYMSYLMFPDEVIDLQEINVLMAESVVSVLAGYGVNARIKLPNDVYVGDKKIAGILPEAIHMGTTLKGLIIGVGINLYHERRFFNEEDLKGTSMKIETDVLIKEEILALDVVRAFTNNLILLKEESKR